MGLSHLTTDLILYFISQPSFLCFGIRHRRLFQDAQLLSHGPFSLALVSS